MLWGATCGGEQRAETPPVGWGEWWGGASSSTTPVLTHRARLSVQLVWGDAHVGRGRLRQGVSVVTEEREGCSGPRVCRSQAHLTGLQEKRKPKY